MKKDSEEIMLMKGNEAIAHAAIRCGCDGYFGYPITPQSEVMETLMELEPWNTTGMVVLQAESEVASINMVYGAAGCGKKSHDIIFQSRCQLDARGYFLYGRCRTTGCNRERNAWWSGLGHHTTQSS